MLNFAIRLIRVIWGLFLFALGKVFIIYAQIGYTPWDVLAAGLAKTVGLSIGNTIIIISIFIVILIFLLGEKIGLGTFLNMILIGIYLDLIMFVNIVPKINNVILGIIMLIGGLFLIAAGSYFYISSGFGAGPRDSLMVAFTRKTGLPIGSCRAIIEILVVTTGWILGGMVGIGTFLAAFGIGFCIQLVFKLFHFNATKIRHETLNDTWQTMQKNKNIPL